MTKTKRRILFYALLGLFLLAGTASVLYAQGWRFDARRGPIQVGAIYVRSYPSDAAIKIDGSPVKSTLRIFESGTLLSGLFPREHELALEREGYAPWRRTFSVAPSTVAEAKNAVLVPQAASGTPGMANFWLSGERDLLVTLSASATIAVNGTATRGDTFLGTDREGMSALTQEKKAFFWSDVSHTTSTEVTALVRSAERMLGGPAIRVAADEKADGTIVVFGKRSFALTEVGNATATAVFPPAGDLRAGPTLARARLAYATATTTAIADRTGKAELSLPAGENGATTDLAWISNDDLAFRTEDGSLFRMNVREGAPQKIASDVRLFSFSPDGSRLAAIGRTSMEVISSDEREYWRFDLPKIGAVTRVEWYRDGRHLFLYEKDRTLFLDLDDARLENLTPVGEGGRADYDPTTNRFFFLARGTLYTLQFAR